MDTNKITDVNIKEYSKIKNPEELKKELPLTQENIKTLIKTREEIINILNGKDKRKIIITGPCSIHNIEEAFEYAKKLKELSEKVNDKFLIIMRTYFEKPRTTTGWKGLIYDPDLNDDCDLEKGIILARKLLLKITSIGIPAGTEFLSTITPQYIDDLVSWAAIGARTTESQPHREMASGLSMPVGFKNNTTGSIDIAVNAISSAIKPHNFPGIDKEGKTVLVKTKGNQYAHLILRGGKEPNYYKEEVSKSIEKLKENKLPTNIIIDCSHGNSKKDHKLQPEVFKDVIKQMNNNNNIKGLMLESNINEGNQKITNPDNLKYSVSVTDKCISFETTEKLIKEGYNSLNL
ncbi:3-deoxy-7-phosphoheptulonate synthase [Candidatus Woesearchaeota archaeon]|nr:3-deoxy-7-phosphoheptulonate synthase [Candidatus Woesearchaeota archaeon]